MSWMALPMSPHTRSPLANAHGICIHVGFAVRTDTSAAPVNGFYWALPVFIAVNICAPCSCCWPVLPPLHMLTCPVGTVMLACVSFCLFEMSVHRKLNFKIHIPFIPFLIPRFWGNPLIIAFMHHQQKIE